MGITENNSSERVPYTTLLKYVFHGNTIQGLDMETFAEVMASTPRYLNGKMFASITYKFARWHTRVTLQEARFEFAEEIHHIINTIWGTEEIENEVDNEENA